MIEGNEKPAEKPVEEPKEAVVFQIILKNNGEMGIAGPILADELASYGILHKALDMVKNLHAPKIHKPGDHRIMDFLRNRR